LVRAAAEGLQRRVVYYADYPYARDHKDDLDSLAPAGFSRRIIPLSEAGLSAWQSASSAYASQISSFWEDETHLREEIRGYVELFGGGSVWEPI
jgi:hypothetical protein